MKKKYFFTISIIILGILTLLKINVKHNNTIAVYIDNALKDNIPSKTDNLYINNIDCDNDATATWDNDNWGLFISNLSKKAKCNLYFIHDNEKPYWQIESVEKVNVLSTDILEFKIAGTDSLGNVYSNLDISNLSFYVNDELESPIKVELTKLEELNKKITYSIKVHMVGGAGNLKVKISSGTLTDTSNNQNDEITLDTGIIVNKNPAKIYYYVRNDYRDLTIINNYYQTVYKENGDDIDLNHILSSDYDLVISYDSVWGTSDVVNTIWQNNINLITIGNDNSETLNIIKSSVSSTICEKSYKQIDNKLTHYFPETLEKAEDPQGLIKFRDDAVVLYTNETNGTKYDTIGYWSQNNKIWFHIQPDIGISNIFTTIIQFTLGELK